MGTLLWKVLKYGKYKYKYMYCTVLVLCRNTFLYFEFKKSVQKVLIFS